MFWSPDSTESRLWSRRRAPAKTINEQIEYSYLVEIDGARHLFHANKLCPYDVRIESLKCDLLCSMGDYDETGDVHVNMSNCSFVFDDDVDFGPIKVLDFAIESILLPSKNTSKKTPGFCGQIEHEINVTADFKPERLKPYNIPEKLKPHVDKQIQELLQMEFIKESKSPMASPMVCVLKKDSLVCCVIDFRYLNGFTVPNALGPPDMQDTQRIGKAKFITTFDGKYSYWTIPIKQEHRCERYPWVYNR